jgi:hypothetical protein
MKAMYTRLVRRTAASAALALCLAGCENTDQVMTSDVTGTWSYSDTTGDVSTMALIQSSAGLVTGAATDGATISGLVSADSVSMTLTYTTNGTSVLSGSIATSTMTGTFTNSLALSGTWTAVRAN